MRILVTGTDGYIGSVMADMLLAAGHEVVGFDTGYYRAGWLYNGIGEGPQTVTRDIRRMSVEDLRGMDAVVHLAELSNDPLGQLAPDVTFDINHRGSVHLANLAKAAGVERFVYMSSCSVYGVGGSEPVTEESPVNPLTSYAVCKTRVERDVGAIAGDTFHPTFLRNATAFGASPRMRFDIVLNNLMGIAWTTGEIRMISDGSPWRPLVHIRDTVAAVAGVLEAPAQRIHNEVFNVGSNDQNYRVREIAEIVAAEVPDCGMSFGAPSADNRSYRVSFDKIREVLPDFRCSWDARAGARELAEVFGRVALDAELFNYRAFTRLDQINYLLESGQVDRQLFWTERGSALREEAAG